MGEALEIAKLLVQPAMKILEMLGNAIGKLYEPQYKRKMADAEAYRIKALSEAVSGASNIPLVYENGSISMNTYDVDDLSKHAALQVNYQLLQEQHKDDSVENQGNQELKQLPDISNDSDEAN